MDYKCLIFDLDGTLIQSLQGILDAVNLTFKQFGFNVVRTYEDGKSYIGAGAAEFARKAMKGTAIPPEKERDIMERFLINYGITQNDSATAFPGVNKMLKDLKNMGYIIAVASNKTQILLDPIVKKLFPDVEFDIALGQRPNIPVKPDPYCIFEIMNKFKLKSDECLYIGDSEFDYKTAHNAGIDCVICKYGYGYYDEPWFKKVKYTVDTTEDLIQMLKR